MASLLLPLRRAPVLARIVVAGAVAALMGAAECRGAADPTDTLQLYMTAGMLSDDNLFRLPAGDPSAFGVAPDRRSDRITRIGAGIRYDKTVSRQRFVANLDLEHNRYQRNINLDHTAGDLGIKWYWAIGSRWTGDLGYDHLRRLSGFADLRLFTILTAPRNLVDLETVSMTGGYWIHPRWRAWGGLEVVEVTNTSPGLKANDVNITTRSLGVEYRTPSENTFGVQLKIAEGIYPNREVAASVLIDNQYIDTTPAVTWAWNLTGQSRFDGRFGYTVRKHDQFPARDFSGPTFQMHYLWMPTGKLRFDANAWRLLWTAETETSNYVLASGLRMTPQWAVTSKFSLRGVLSRETRSYLGDPRVLFSAFPVREDSLRTLQLAAVYAPMRNAELQALLEKGSRTSNQQRFDYDYSTVAFNLKLKF